ncbi:MAG: hypothetical protein DI547_05075 [Sphingobium sp.]|nr:MAG: hypothetical protein DI547_05075 [Sphingobium sp.]
MKHSKIEAGTEPAAFDQFTDYVAAVVDSRKWVVGARLTARLRANGYGVAIPPKRFDVLKQAWEDAHGWAMGFPPEMQTEWLREAVRAYRGKETGQGAIVGKKPMAPYPGARALIEGRGFDPSGHLLADATRRADEAEAMLAALYARLERYGVIYAERVPVEERRAFT